MENKIRNPYTVSIPFKQFYDMFLSINNYKKFNISITVDDVGIRNWNEKFIMDYNNYKQSKNDLLEKYSKYNVYAFWINETDRELNILVHDWK